VLEAMTPLSHTKGLLHPEALLAPRLIGRIRLELQPALLVGVFLGRALAFQGDGRFQAFFSETLVDVRVVVSPVATPDQIGG